MPYLIMKIFNVVITTNHLKFHENSWNFLFLLVKKRVWERNLKELVK